jgi:hypothetical protein
MPIVSGAWKDSMQARVLLYTKQLLQNPIPHNIPSGLADYNMDPNPTLTLQFLDVGSESSRWIRIDITVSTYRTTLLNQLFIEHNIK